MQKKVFLMLGTFKGFLPGFVGSRAEGWIKCAYLRNRFRDARIISPISYMWKRRDTISLGSGASLIGVSLNSDTAIGKNTVIYENCQISGYEDAPLKIGSYCAIARNCLITTTNHPITYPSISNFGIFSPGDYEKIIKRSASAPVTIGNSVWMGSCSAVLPGVDVGDGAIIGAGAVVTKDVEPFTIVGGVPAKPIKKRFSDDAIRQMKRIGWWDWDDGKIMRNRKFFTTDLSTFKGDLEKLVVD